MTARSVAVIDTAWGVIIAAARLSQRGVIETIEIHRPAGNAPKQARLTQARDISGGVYLRLGNDTTRSRLPSIADQ